MTMLNARLAPLGLAALVLAAPGHGEDIPQIDNPPRLLAAPADQAAKTRLGSLNTAALLNAPLELGQPQAAPREVTFDLDIRYRYGWIRNPSLERPGQIHYDKVVLRSYLPGVLSSAAPPSSSLPSATPFIAPLIEVYPGQTVRIGLNNKLDRDVDGKPIRDPSCTDQGGSANQPHCFNGTNLHTHGLWINPAGNSDNVLLSINPGVSFQYEYNIPPDHPAGTFWYHTHRHGSTALQVSSGMAGALIVRGTRQPTQQKNGDIDTLLQPYAGAGFRERVLVFQQIQYACRFKAGQYKDMIKTYGNTATPPNEEDQRYRCDDGDVGGIEGYDQFGPKTWQESGRYTSINGVVLGKMVQARAGDVERWRMVHAGVRDTINLKLRRLSDNAPPLAGLFARQMDDYVTRYCRSDTELDLPLIAADGLTMGKVQTRKSVVFQPGYRWDALVSFPSAGKYCLINDVKVSSTIDRSAPSARLLGVVDVAPGQASRPLQEVLIGAARAHFPPAVANKVSAELRSGMKLSSFVPHPDIDPKEVTGTQALTFNIDVSQPKSAFFQVDGKPYAGERIDRTLKLGGVDEWTLRSDFVSHPYHIHVNPFQIVKIVDPKGRDISAEGAPDSMDPGDTQYSGLKNIWKDTLWVKNIEASNDPKIAAAGRYTITIRTRYERYIGDFVLHCHILDHEDQGMMQNIRIALPDGRGGTAFGHH